jgi:hypothetical protein
MSRTFAACKINLLILQVRPTLANILKTWSIYYTLLTFLNNKDNS